MKGQSRDFHTRSQNYGGPSVDFTAARAPRCAVTLCCAVPSQRRSQPTHALVSLYTLSTLRYRQTRPLAAVHQGPRRRPSPLPRPGRAPQRNAAHTPTRGFFCARRPPQYINQWLPSQGA